MQCERCRSYAINPGQNGRGDDDLHLCDVCYWRARAEAKEANAAKNKAERLTGHQFQGRLDRWCEICNLPDRHPIHRWDRAQAEINENSRLPIADGFSAEFREDGSVAILDECGGLHMANSAEVAMVREIKRLRAADAADATEEDVEGLDLAVLCKR